MKNENQHQTEEEIISKADVYEVVNKASKLTKQIANTLEEGCVSDEDAKAMREGVKQLSNSIKLIKDAVLLQKTFEKNSPNQNQLNSVKRMKYLFAIRHRKKFINYILHDLQSQIPNAFENVDINILCDKIDALF